MSGSLINVCQRKFSGAVERRITEMVFFRYTIFFVCFAGFAASASASEVVKIKPRSGVFLKMLVDAPADAKAVAILFPGGHGRVVVKNDGTHKGLKGNFVVRTRQMFVDNGLVAVVFDAPSDHRDKKGLTFDYRMTEEHAGDIKKVMAKIREKFPGLPIWLVGTSRGSTSVANAAANIKSGGAEGIVLTSSVGVSSRHGGNVLDFDLAAIKVPALVVHHLKDECAITPVWGAKDIKNALTGAKSAEILIFEGGETGGNPCKAKSHHGFLGIEQKVVDAISAWIKSH